MKNGKGGETMKKRSVLTTVVAVGVLAGVLCGCGSLSLNLGGGEADRMKNYVQGYLDLTYLGQANDDYLQEMDLTEEEAQERYEQGLQVEVEFFENAIGIFDYPTDEITQRLTDLYKEIYSHSDYTVVSANKMDSGNYVVEVTVRPIEWDRRRQDVYTCSVIDLAWRPISYSQQLVCSHSRIAQSTFCFPDLQASSRQGHWFYC